MSSLGRNGRFGNQVFQYAFLRLYTQKHGLAYRVPQWIGQELFGHRDDPIGDLRLPLFYDQVGESTVLDRQAQPVVNVDVCGYFQYHTSYYAPHKKQFRGFFQPVPAIAEPLREAMGRLRQGGRTIVAIHVRRGDFAGGIHYAAPIAWYQQWLEQNWKRWTNPLLYVATDEPQKVMGSLREYHPVDESAMKVQVPHAPYYVDYYALTQADALAISNSSFSFSAAMLNETAREFVRPSRSAGRLVSFDPWDSEPMMAEDGRDEQAAFYEGFYDRVSRVMERWEADRRSAECQAQLRACRRDLAALWLGMSDDVLRVVYNTSLSKAQALLSSPAIRELRRDDEDERLASQFICELAKGLGSVWSTQYLLAAMLFCDPTELPMRHDFSQIPQWLVTDYMHYLRAAATVHPTEAASAPMTGLQA